MFRLVTFCCLLASLASITVTTLNYVDPPITDPLVFGFIKSDRYLPPGDPIRRVDLYSSVQKLLADDRRAYKRILWLSGVALLSTVGLFVSGSSRGGSVKLATSPNGDPAEWPADSQDSGGTSLVS